MLVLCQYYEEIIFAIMPSCLTCFYNYIILRHKNGGLTLR